MLATAVVAVSSQPALQPDGFLQSPLLQSAPAARKSSQWGRQWTVQPGGLNCYDGHGAPGASGKPHWTSIRLDECEKECRSLPGCGAVVVKFESNPDRVLAAAGKGPAAALVDCYLREEVRVEDCIHSGIHSGYELFVLGPRKVWQQQQQAEKYLTPKDAATCVSNNPRSIDSWCRDMCGAGVCTAEMCVCDGEDAAANGTKATDLLWVPQVPSSAQAVDLDDFGESYPDRNVRDDVPSDVPVEVIGPEVPVEEPMSQWDKSLMGDVPVGIVADASPSPRPLSDFDSWHGDIFEQQSDEQRAAEQAEGAPEPSPAPVASPAPKKPKALDTSAGPLGGGMPSGIPTPVIAEENFVTPIDPRTCVSMSESATDDWCVDACEAGMCSAQMCKCDEDANLVLARREPLAKGQLLPNDVEPSHMHSGSYESLTRRTANFIAPASKSPNQQQAVREVALVTGPAQAAAAHLDTPDVDILD